MTRHIPASRRNRAIIWLVVPFVIVAFVIGIRWAVKLKQELTRASWKNATLAQLVSANENIATELETLRSGEGAGEHRRWTSDHVLLMTNGEHLVYAFWHGANSGFVDHLFLARSSDGRWLYSTYHFCNGVAALIGDEQPGSIADFEKRYSALEFDGKSDECLQHTWPLAK